MLSNNPVHQIQWEPIILNTGAPKFYPDVLQVRYRPVLKTDTKPSLFFKFSTKVVELLGMDIKTDRITVLQDPMSPYHYLLCKSTSGLKVQHTYKSTASIIAFRYERKELPIFDWVNANYYCSAPGKVTVIIPETNIILLNK